MHLQLSCTFTGGSVVEDVTLIRNHPLVPPDITIYGYIYHIHHGTLEAVAEANRIGQPRA